MTLNGVMAVILRYLTEICSFARANSVQSTNQSIKKFLTWLKVKPNTCIAPCMVYKPLQSAQAWITQFYLQ